MVSNCSHFYIPIRLPCSPPFQVGRSAILLAIFGTTSAYQWRIPSKGKRSNWGNSFLPYSHNFENELQVHSYFDCRISDKFDFDLINARDESREAMISSRVLDNFLRSGWERVLHDKPQEFTHANTDLAKLDIKPHNLPLYLFQLTKDEYIDDLLEENIFSNFDMKAELEPNTR